MQRALCELRREASCAEAYTWAASAGTRCGLEMQMWLPPVRVQTNGLSWARFVKLLELVDLAQPRITEAKGAGDGLNALPCNAEARQPRNRMREYCTSGSVRGLPVRAVHNAEVPCSGSYV
jgi:hypothetical protein